MIKRYWHECITFSRAWSGHIIIDITVPLNMRHMKMIQISYEVWAKATLRINS